LVDADPLHIEQTPKASAGLSRAAASARYSSGIRGHEPVGVFPLFMKLAGRSCLVVGGGAAAARKAELLLRAGARVTVASPTLPVGLAEVAGAGQLKHRRSTAIGPAAIRNQALVIVASDDLGLDQRVAEVAQTVGVPVNVIDRPELSTFITGAIVDRSPVLVAISTSGTAPVLAREIRLAIERLLPPTLAPLARFADRFRTAVKAAIPRTSSRRRFWESFFKGPVAAAVLRGEERAAQVAMLGLVNGGEASPAMLGVVHLVGAGPGDPELLTLRALRLLGEADVIVYDRLIDPDILDRARRDAERVYVGKSKGHHSKSQDEINALLVAFAQAGKRVVRLKSGDPFVFGRGGEELEYLRRHGVSVEVVPGISAAFGCAAAAQIPLTHRALANTVTFVSGHNSAGEIELDWASLVRRRETLVIYMGVSAAGQIARALIAHGAPLTTPAAVIENGTRSNQRTLVGTLAELDALCVDHNVTSPALIVIGEVVRLADVEGAVSLATPGTAVLDLARAVNA